MSLLRRSLLVLILLALPGLASSAALGQTIGDLTTVTTVASVTTVATVTTSTATATTAVTPTLTESVSAATEEGTALVESGGEISGTPSVTSGGGSSGGTTSKDGGSLGGATAPITSTASSLTGKSGTGSTAEAPKQETGSPKSEGPSIQTISCGEASQDPRTFGAFLLTLKEGERGVDGGNGAKGGSGVLSAAGDGQQSTPSLPTPAPLPDEPGFPTWLGLLALATFALGVGALLAIVTQSLLAERRLARPASDGAVRRSV